MAGPFPGMDPYLENPDTWQGTHNALITVIRATLNAALPAPYVAFAETRCYVERPSETIRPDVLVQRVPSLPESGRVAVAERFSPALEFRVEAQEFREAYLHILNTADSRRVVTVIALLSPTNKNSRTEGRRRYLEKQQALLQSDTHLLEIDLLRDGAYSMALPEEAFATETSCDYRICLHRADTPGHFTLWPVSLPERLPIVRVPLDSGEDDVPLDLQAVFDRNYDEGAYARFTDYSLAPVPPLSTEKAIWADALLREKGLRP